MKRLLSGVLFAVLFIAGFICFGHEIGSLLFLLICATLPCGGRRIWRPAVVAALMIFVPLNIADWLFFNRKLSVEKLIYSFPWNTSSIIDTIESPSGKAVVYVIVDSWLDAFYSVYIRTPDGFLSGPYDLSTEGIAKPSYHRDINAFWRDSRFIIHIHTDVFTYDEPTGRITRKQD